MTWGGRKNTPSLPSMARVCELTVDNAPRHRRDLPLYPVPQLSGLQDPCGRPQTKDHEPRLPLGLKISPEGHHVFAARAMCDWLCCTPHLELPCRLGGERQDYLIAPQGLL